MLIKLPWPLNYLKIICKLRCDNQITTKRKNAQRNIALLYRSVSIVEKKTIPVMLVTRQGSIQAEWKRFYSLSKTWHILPQLPTRVKVSCYRMKNLLFFIKTLALQSKKWQKFGKMSLIQETPVIIVTGASRCIGASVGRWLGKIKAALTLIARSEKTLRQVAESVEHLGGHALPLVMDVANASACRQAVEETIWRFGRLNAIVNNAGIFQPMAPLVQTNPDDWRYNIEVNLLGPVYMTIAAISELRRQKGRIVNVSGCAAIHTIESGSAYCASKAALNQFTKVLAAEESELTVVAVRPGAVDTQMQALLRSAELEVLKPVVKTNR